MKCVAVVIIDPWYFGFTLAFKHLYDFLDLYMCLPPFIIIFYIYLLYIITTYYTSRCQRVALNNKQVIKWPWPNTRRSVFHKSVSVEVSQSIVIMLQPLCCLFWICPLIHSVYLTPFSLLIVSSRCPFPLCGPTPDGSWSSDFSRWFVSQVSVNYESSDDLEA